MKDCCYCFIVQLTVPRTSPYTTCPSRDGAGANRTSLPKQDLWAGSTRRKEEEGGGALFPVCAHFNTVCSLVVYGEANSDTYKRNLSLKINIL